MSESASTTVHGTTRITLHRLASRPDGQGWIVGRIDAGDFIAVPPAGHRAITLLSAGHTVDEVRSALHEEGFGDLDVADFVAALIDLGYVSELDGSAMAGPAVAPSSLAWLRERHVRWLLHPATAVVTSAVTLAGLVAVLVGAAPIPTYQDLLWSSSGAAVILGNAALAWSIVLLHELAHLAVARAVGVPGRVNLSTRLQFLVVQTDISGMWAAPRPARLTAYLAGIIANLLLSAVCTLLLAATSPTGLPRHLLLATVLLSLTMIPPQLLIFMRTDVYFVLQELTGNGNLYAEGSAYSRYLASRLWHAGRERAKRTAVPVLDLPPRQFLAVRLYTVLLVLGTAGCLAAAAFVTVPATVSVLARTWGPIADAPTAGELLDAAAVLTITGGLLILWARAWWQRHGHRVRRPTKPYIEGRF